jgi:hypothetical protein
MLHSLFYNVTASATGGAFANAVTKGDTNTAPGINTEAMLQIKAEMMTSKLVPGMDEWLLYQNNITITAYLNHQIQTEETGVTESADPTSLPWWCSFCQNKFADCTCHLCSTCGRLFEECICNNDARRERMRSELDEWWNIESQQFLLNGETLVDIDSIENFPTLSSKTQSNLGIFHKVNPCWPNPRLRHLSSIIQSHSPSM